MLDYSAAFDTIDHSILFQRLHQNYGLSGSALEWVTSYFTGRQQAINIGSAISDTHNLPYGMPQGSIFGPFSYPKYAAPIARIAEKHGIKYHQYADDTQLYVECDVNSAQACKQRLEQCIAEMVSGRFVGSTFRRRRRTVHFGVTANRLATFGERSRT